MLNPIDNKNKEEVNYKNWLYLGKNKYDIEFYCNEVKNMYPQAEKHRHIIQFLIVGNHTLLFWPLYYANDIMRHYTPFSLHEGKTTYNLSQDQLRMVHRFIKNHVLDKQKTA